MKRQSSILIIITALVMSAFVMGSVQEADALFIVALNDTGTSGIDVLIADNTASGVSVPIPGGGMAQTTATDGSLDGQITFSGPLGPFSVVFTAAQSKPLIGGPDSASINVVNTSISGSSSGTLEIWITDTNFTLAQQTLVPITLTNEVLLGASSYGTEEVTSQGYLDSGNNEFVTSGSSTGVVGPLTGKSFSGSKTVLLPPLGSPSPFSLTEYASVVHPGIETTSFEKHLTASTTPEPTTLLLLGFGLVGLAGYGWRRKRKQS